MIMLQVWKFHFDIGWFKGEDMVNGIKVELLKPIGYSSMILFDIQVLKLCFTVSWFGDNE